MKKLNTVSFLMACLWGAPVATTRAAILAGPIVNPANGHTYCLLTENSWTASESEARTLGGHLATVRNQAENQWLIDTFWPLSGVARTSLWIGLNDSAVEGTFVWASGEPVTYTHWNSSEPNNQGNEDYVHILDQSMAVPFTPGYWNDMTNSVSGASGWSGQHFGVVEIVPATGGATTLGYWRFEEGTLNSNVPADGTSSNPAFNDTVSDSSGNGNHMRTNTDYFAPKYITAPTATVPQTGATNSLALEFKMHHDVYTSGKSINTADLTAGFTVEASIRADSIKTQLFVNKEGKPTGSPFSPFWFRRSDSNGHLEVSMLDTAGVPITIISNNPAISGQWYHLAAVNNGNSLAFYIKGPGDSDYVLQGTRNTVGGMINTAASWIIGRGMWAGVITDYVDGAVDEVRISAGALSPTQFLFHGASASVPVVSNAWAAQKAGTRLVDVNYDLSGGLPPYTVTLQGSLDGGVSWTLPVATVSGNVGTVTTAGTNRVVTWNAGADWAGRVSANVKFRVNVTDSATPPAPTGFSLIPAGSFTMGQTGIATPAHSVYVSAFYMGKYEVTKELWDEVRAWGMANGRGYDLAVGNGSYASKGINHPVHSITWYDVVKWCNARSEKENLVPCYSVSGATYKTGQNSAVVCNFAASGFRLPTEAEWEKAARDGVAGKNFPWGTDTISQNQANYCVYSSNGTTNYYSYDVTPRPPATGNYFYHPSYTAGGYPYSSPVGSFAPNGYGLYDMAGNMWERCWDWYGSYTAGAQTDPRGAASGSARVYRGGSWDYYADYCRVAIRSSYDPGSVSYDLGFRVARSSVP